MGNGKNVFIICQQYTIWRCRNTLGHMKTSYNAKNIGNFVDFSCMIFWAQNVLIPPDQNLSIPLDQIVLILLVSNINNGNIRTFWHRKLCMKTWYSSKSFWILSKFYRSKSSMNAYFYLNLMVLVFFGCSGHFYVLFLGSLGSGEYWKLQK